MKFIKVAVDLPDKLYDRVKKHASGSHMSVPTYVVYTLAKDPKSSDEITFCRQVD